MANIQFGIPSGNECFKTDLARPIKPIEGGDHPDGQSTERRGQGQEQGGSRDRVEHAGPSEDLRREEDRLATMTTWPCKEYLDPQVAARSGLYFTGIGDTLRCHFCRIELKQWQRGDDVEADHGRWSPTCPLLLHKPVGNVPRGRDECGSAQISGRPVHPAYMSESSRVSSFKGWPLRMKQTASALADAGFYYTGSGDQTICYYCGGGLKDWEDEDNPWEQHAIWFSRCPYLKAVKGEEFILKANSKNDTSAPLPTSGSVASATASAPACAPARATAHAPLQVLTTVQMDRAEATSPEESKLCKICYDREHEVCFVPCGHVVACAKCAMSLTACPVCRQPFSNLVKLFFS